MTMMHPWSLSDFACRLNTHDAALVGTWHPLANARRVVRSASWTPPADLHRPLESATPSRKRGIPLRLQAIGFELGGNATKGWESNVEQLLRIAKSLLLHQQVLKSKPAQAFLNVQAHKTILHLTHSQQRCSLFTEALCIRCYCA